MVLRDIPREEWDTFLDRFSRQHRNEPVTVAKSDMRDGLQIAERAVPLLAITHSRTAQRISITVGEAPSGEVTHTVLQPDGVAIEEPAEADENPQAAVHLMGGGQHLIVRLESQSTHA
jgi:hypothetical protein